MDFGQTKAGLQLFLQGSSTSDPFVYQNLLPKLLRDWGWEDRLGEEGLEDKVLEQLVSLACFTAKGPKVKLTRWMSVFDCISWHDPFTHSKLLAYICWGMSAGWAKTSLGSSLTPWHLWQNQPRARSPRKSRWLVEQMQFPICTSRPRTACTSVHGCSLMTGIRIESGSYCP